MKLGIEFGLVSLRGKTASLVTLAIGVVLGLVGCSKAAPALNEGGVRLRIARRLNPHEAFVAQSQTSETVRASAGIVPAKYVQGSTQRRVDEVLHQAEAAYECGRFEEALKECRHALDLDPKSAHAYYLLGLIQGERGDVRDAKQAMIASLKLDPKRVASHIYLARLYLETKEYRPAAEEFKAAVKLGDSSGVARYGLALVLLAESRYSEALPHLRAAVEANSKDSEKLFTLMATELKLKQMAEARRHLVLIEKASPNDPWFLYRVGKVLQEYHLTKEAESGFEKAADLLSDAQDTAPPPPDVKLSDVYLQFSQVRFSQRDYEAALQYLNKIDAMGVESSLRGSVLYLEGGSLLATGHVLEAREKLEQAVQADPSQPEYLVRLIWADLLEGDLKAATARAETARGMWPQEPLVQHIMALVAREGSSERQGVPYSQEWHVKGEGVVCCPCAAPCPCRSNGSPTHGHCENTGVYRIAQGHYGAVSLDGFVFVIVSDEMETADFPATLYVDRQATDEQIIALERLAQSFNLLRPSIFLNVKRAEIAFVRSAGEVYEIKIPGALRIQIRRQLDANGKPLMQTAALDYLANMIEYARNLIYQVWDQHGALQWDYSGRQANYRAFDIDSRAYKERTVLIQFADYSGYFNKKQLELIKSLKLPTLASYPKPGK